MCVFAHDRVSLVLAFLGPQVCQEHLDLKASQDQRATLVSLATLVHLDDLDLMVLQDLKVFWSYVMDFKV